MKNLLLSFSFVFISCFSLSAQIGVSGAFSNISTPGWEEILQNENIDQFNNGYTLSLDYWFRLKDYRVEFLPELSYSGYDNLVERDGETSFSPSLDANLNILAFSFNTQIYLFDIEGDCDCPTWGKEGGFFNKGFYFMAGPGISLVQHTDEINFADGSEEPSIIDESTIRLMLSAGAGFDIGITKAITLTLFGKFKWHSANQWGGLNTLLDSSTNQFDDTDSVITQFEPGLKIHYRWGE